MRKIKLLIISDEMEIGGSQRQIFNILTNLDNTKYDLNLLYFRTPSVLVEELKKAGIKVTKIDKHNKFDIFFLVKLIKLFRAEKYDLIHAFSFTGELWGAFAHSISLSSGKYLSSVRGTYEWYSKPQWLLKKLVTLYSEYVVSNSTSAGQFAFRKMNLDTTRLKIIHNGINLTSIEPVADMDFSKISMYTWNLVFIGRLVDHKNVPCLLRAIKIVNKTLAEQIGVLIIGDGPDRQSLEKTAEDFQLNNVKFLGERSDTTIIYRHADAVVLPSFREGMSNTILESMCNGTPVIASNVGGSPEIIKDGSNGLLFASDNEKELADKIMYLYNNTHISAELATSAKHDCESLYSIQIMSSNFDQLYSSVIHK